MDAFEFGRNGIMILLGVLGYGGAILLALWAVGLVLRMLVVMLSDAREDGDKDAQHSEDE